MRSITTDEAAAHLPDLLMEVELGSHILITRQGKAVAELSPVRAATRPKRSFDEIVAAMDDLMKGNRLDGITIQELRDEGRRF